MYQPVLRLASAHAYFNPFLLCRNVVVEGKAFRKLRFWHRTSVASLETLGNGRLVLGSCRIFSILILVRQHRSLGVVMRARLRLRPEEPRSQPRPAAEDCRSCGASRSAAERGTGYGLVALWALPRLRWRSCFLQSLRVASPTAFSTRCSTTDTLVERPALCVSGFLCL